MNLEHVEKIAEAVLFEGYMLYPYRVSAVKNQQRWNFGVLCPRSYSELQNGSEAWAMQTECLLQGDPSTRLSVKIRFLQIVNRSIGELPHPLHELPLGAEPEFELVDRMEVSDQAFVPWQEAIEREVATLPLHTAAFHQPLLFEFPSGRELEPLRTESGMIAGVIIREWETLFGAVEIDSKQCLDGVIKITVRIHNLTSYKPLEHQSRADAVMHSLVSAHTILMLERGQFISMLDPQWL